MVSFDVDKTLFRKPALTTVARALGIGERWDGLDEMEQKKRITIGQCLARQYELLVGMKVHPSKQGRTRRRRIKRRAGLPSRRLLYRAKHEHRQGQESSLIPNGDG